MRNFSLFISMLALAVAIATCAVTVKNARGQSVYPANGCTVDRPNARVVRGTIVSCTLLFCLGEWVCDREYCWRGPAKDCNTCMRSPDTKMCLTDEELRKAGGE